MATLSIDEDLDKGEMTMTNIEDETLQSASSLTPSSLAHVTQPRRHNIPRIFLVIITVAIYVVSEFVIRTDNSNLFTHTSKDLSQRFPSPLDPIPEIDLVMWPIVYIFQASWLLIVLYAIFRKTTITKTKPDGSQITTESYLYLLPNVFNTQTFYLFNAAQVLVIACKFIYDNEILTGKIVAQIIIHLCLIGASIYARKGVKAFDAEICDSQLSSCFKSGPFPGGQGSRKSYELLFLRIFFLNGLSLYAAWALFCSFIGLCSFMIKIEYLTVQKDIASILSINILLIHVTIFVIIDNFYLGDYSPYILSPYIVFMVTVGGSVSSEFDSRDVIKMQSVFVLIFCVGFSILKLFNLLRKCK